MSNSTELRSAMDATQAESIEKVIADYERCLDLIACEANSTDWASLQSKLGKAYHERTLGNRADNLEKSIIAYEQALQVFTREAFPESWARTLRDLGLAYRERLRGERADNLEKSITCCSKALQVFTREIFPADWASTQIALGIACRNRIRGEHANNIEKAIEAYNKALQVLTREDLPADWGRAQNNLGIAYNHRIQGDRFWNLEKAIAAYKEALQIFTRQAFSEKWALVQAHLAEVLTQKALLSKTNVNLDSAITLLEESLEVFTPGSYRSIDPQYQLGNALVHRYDISRNPEDLKRALQAYKTALNAINPEHYDRQNIWQALPVTQSILGSRLVRDGRWQEGLQLLSNSVSQLGASDDALAHANALFEMGRAHETLSDWANARLYYRDALRLYQHINHPAGIAKSQEGLGGVLLSQGNLEKGLAQLAKSCEGYNQLKKIDRAEAVDSLYQTAKRALDKQRTKVQA